MATNTLTPEQRAEMKERARKARHLVVKLAAKGDKAWQMCVPPQPDDSDMLLTAVADDVDTLLATCTALEARAERAEGLLSRAVTIVRQCGVHKENCPLSDDASPSSAKCTCGLVPAMDALLADIKEIA